MGSNAKGKEEVQRAAKARNGLLFLRKSLRGLLVALLEVLIGVRASTGVFFLSSAVVSVEYLKWKTLRWRRSYTTVSDNLIGTGRPSKSVAVMNRSRSSTYGVSKI